MRTINDITFTRIDNDTNGNPRYVCHFLNLLTENEKLDRGPRGIIEICNHLDDQYKLAVKRSKKLGGKKYHNKKYGGGIVFQSYNISKLAEEIEQIKMA